MIPSVLSDGRVSGGMGGGGLASVLHLELIVCVSYFLLFPLTVRN